MFWISVSGDSSFPYFPHKWGKYGKDSNNHRKSEFLPFFSPRKAEKKGRIDRESLHTFPPSKGGRKVRLPLRYSLLFPFLCKQRKGKKNTCRVRYSAPPLQPPSPCKQGSEGSAASPG